MQSDGEGDSSDNLDRDDSSDDGDLDDGVGNDHQLKRQVPILFISPFFLLLFLFLLSLAPRAVFSLVLFVSFFPEENRLAKSAINESTS